MARTPLIEPAVEFGELELHLVGERDAVLHRELVERSGDRPLHAGAVVTPDPHDEGVVEFTEFLDGVDHSADVVVGVLGEPGVDLHLAGVERLEVLGDVIPCREGVVAGVSSVSPGITPSSFCRANVSSRSLSHPWSNLPLVLVGPLLGDVVGGVAAPRREVDEEGLVGVLGAHRVQPLDGPIGHRIREVVRVVLVVVLGRGANDLLVLGQAGIPLARSTAEDPVEVVEAPAVGPTVERSGGTLLAIGRQVPLPEDGRAVAVVLEDPGKRRAVSGQDRRVPREAAGELTDGTEPNRMVVAPCQQRGAGRRAQSGDVEPVVAKPPLAPSGCSWASGSGRRTCSDSRTRRRRSGPEVRWGALGRGRMAR